MPPGLIRAVSTSSLAFRAGIQAGDFLLAINGRRPRDVIDVRLLAGDERLLLEFERGGVVMSAEAQRRYGEELGLEFESPTFDRIRRCANRCEFCFVDQMPRGLRSSLYLRDDDYRYSFLFGNYVTLNGLDEPAWDRIASQHLSPLYVSVHTTDPDLRGRMMGSDTPLDIIARLRRLAALGVEAHTQIVVVPEVNDGAQLDRSIKDLAELYPSVRSISVVPVGITKFHRGPCRVHTALEMCATAEQVHRSQDLLRRSHGVGLAYLSDEWYLKLDWPVPPAEHYDGLDLSENGVGAARRFVDNAPAALQPYASSGEPVTLVTGTLFAPVLRRLVAGQPHLDVVPVINEYFGETVSSAGLLTGSDVVSQLVDSGMGESVVLPPHMMGGPEGVTLDGLSVADLRQSLGRRVVVGHPTSAEALTWTS